LSQLVLVLGGLLEHARALAGICAPTVILQAPRRGRSLSGATWAPAYIATETTIVPPASAFRSVASSCGCRMARRIRISRRPRWPPRIGTVSSGAWIRVSRSCDLYEWSEQQIRERGIGLLPQSLHEAMDALAADEVIKAGIGNDLAAEFIRLKRMEWIEYSRHVSEWRASVI